MLKTSSKKNLQNLSHRHWISNVKIARNFPEKVWLRQEKLGWWYEKRKAENDVCIYKCERMLWYIYASTLVKCKKKIIKHKLFTSVIYDIVLSRILIQLCFVFK